MAKNFAEVMSIPAQKQSPRDNNNTNTSHSHSQSSSQHSITLVYETKLPQKREIVMVTWNKTPNDHSLSITMENPSEQNIKHPSCKIDSISKWGKKGLKSLEFHGDRLDLFWDFRHAKFLPSDSDDDSYPQPRSDYYVAIVYRKETLLLLGDMEKEAYERTRSKPCLEEAVLLCKRESVQGKKVFCTRAMLEKGKTEHDIVIETSLCGPGDPEMWVSIDGYVATRIMNLNWRFRGNETVIVKGLTVEIMWDVHDWLFNGDNNDDGSSSSSSLGQGLFIFKPGGSLESQGSSSNSSSSREESTERSSSSSSSYSENFCHFLYAWRTN